MEGSNSMSPESPHLQKEWRTEHKSVTSKSQLASTQKHEADDAAVISGPMAPAPKNPQDIVTHNDCSVNSRDTNDYTFRSEPTGRKGSVAILLELLCIALLALGKASATHTTNSTTVLDAFCATDIHPYANVTGNTGFCSKIIEPYFLYTCTEYMVTTFDGFQIAVHLIETKSIWGNATAGDVLFLHSSVLGGDSWFIADSPTPLALANAGYSVWIAHTRGTQFTFGHEILDPTEQEFWNWDLDEVANYDFPSLLDFVISHNGGHKIHFVGFSQGARAGLGTITYQTDRVKNLASATLLAPIVYMANTESRVFLAVNYTDLVELGYHIGLGAISFAVLAGITNPRDDDDLFHLENKFLCEVTGPNCCIDAHKAYTALTSPYAFVTYKNLAHLRQSMQIQMFKAFNYGSSKLNTEVYRTSVPPMYRFEGIPDTLPVLVVYGENDRLSTPADINVLVSHFRTTPQLLSLPSYAHLDLLMSYTLELDVNVPLVSFIRSSTNHTA